MAARVVDSKHGPSIISRIGHDISTITNLADPITPVVTGGIKAAGGIGNVVKGGETAITDSGKFFVALTNPDTWVRVGEVVFGLVLIVVGVDYMTKAGLASKAATAGKAALL